ncbi:YihY/virulence factor BrkB family protein [Baekduia sp. Peel2402]|uniref:YihY/virulence factor BrkB family protein n=1 Tax=Baekduia sp. Peel2402 TaxID=3458296 RepID=UPI00403E770F
MSLSRGGASAYLGAAKRAFSEFRRHEMTDVAAALTYYAMMSLFPAIVLATSLFSLIGDESTVTKAVDYLARQGADQETQDAIGAVMEKIVSASGGAVSVALVISVAIALNGASGAFGASGRALNRVYRVEEDRGFVGRKLTDLGTTLAIVVVLLVVVAALFLGGGFAEDLLGSIGLGSTASLVWSLVRWPIALGGMLMVYALIYTYAPDVENRKLRWITPGAIAGVLIWIVASIGFGIYIKNFSSYGAAYGAAGAVIVLLLWLWLSSCAFLFGGELNAELERVERAGAGAPPAMSPAPS